jgi:hypothetical protein
MAAPGAIQSRQIQFSAGARIKRNPKSIARRQTSDGQPPRSKRNL